MNSRLILKELNNLAVVQRVLYLVLAFYLLLLQALQVQNDVKRTTLYVTILCVIAIADEVFNYCYYFHNMRFLSIWRYIQYILTLISLYSCFDYVYATVALMALLISYIMGFMLAGDLFDTYSNAIRIVFLGIPIIVFVIVMFSYSKQYAWIYMPFSMILLFIVLIKELLFMRSVASHYESELNLKNTMLNESEDSNQELTTYKERINTVNTELNIQKMQLKNAYDQIQEANKEIEVQSEIARFISTTFDIGKVVSLITTSIVETKKVAFAAIYIDKNVYMNPQSNCVVKAVDDGIKRKLTRDLPEFYLNYKQKYSEILIDNEVTAEKYPFIGETPISSMIVRPLYTDNKFFGVLLVGSSKEKFANSNLAFYDVIISQIQIAIQNTKNHRHTERMAQTDGLTGINNRTYFNSLFQNTVKQVLLHRSSICVALFDIDKFKRVNDTYGHLAGDEVIKKVASITQKVIDEYDGYICRYGGEEFVMVLPNYSLEAATPIVEQLHKEIANAVVVYGGERIGMSVSIGLTAYPEICENPNDLLKRADWAMYYAKEHGRNQIKIDGSDVEPVS